MLTRVKQNKKPNRRKAILCATEKWTHVQFIYCIWHLHLFCKSESHLSRIHKHQPTDETNPNRKYSKQKQQYSLRENAGKQVEREMLHDAILVRCGLSIAGSKFWNRCLPNFKLLCLFVYFSTMHKVHTNKQKIKEIEDDVRDTVFFFASWILLSFFFALFCVPLSIFIRKCLFFTAHFCIVRFIRLFGFVFSFFCKIKVK